MPTAAMPNYLFAIDTLQFSKRLQKAGLKIEIAEEIAEAIKDSQTQTIEGLATKLDLRELRQDLRSLEQKFDQKFEMVEQKFGMVEQKFGMVEQKFEMVEQKFEMIEQKFDMVEQKFGTIEQKFETLEYKLTVKMFVAMIAAVSIVTWLDKLIG
jgi:predicted nuclease with TOPRIM domain